MKTESLRDAVPERQTEDETTKGQDESVGESTGGERGEHETEKRTAVQFSPATDARDCGETQRGMEAANVHVSFGVSSLGRLRCRTVRQSKNPNPERTY